MIFVSSNICKAARISTQVHTLAERGFRNIELTGGTDYYEGMVKSLEELKARYGLHYRLHNYFPPPKKHFVFNLASPDADIRGATLEHAERAIELSFKLGSNKIAFHAGFFIRIASDELGSDIASRALYPEDEAIDCFVENLTAVQRLAGADLEIYIENNVVSSRNRRRFPSRCPSMLTRYSELLDLRSRIDFNLLLDVAHLKVSCRTYELSFQEEFQNLYLQKMECKTIFCI